jgi:hypothetical protein
VNRAHAKLIARRTPPRYHYEYLDTFTKKISSFNFKLEVELRWESSEDKFTLNLRFNDVKFHGERTELQNIEFWWRFGDTFNQTKSKFIVSVFAGILS